MYILFSQRYKINIVKNKLFITNYKKDFVHLTTNLKTSNMKAIELLKKSIGANLSIAESYHEKAEFAKFKKDIKEFEYNIKSTNEFLEKVKECEEAIEEINELIKNK